MRFRTVEGNADRSGAWGLGMLAARWRRSSRRRWGGRSIPSARSAGAGPFAYPALPLRGWARLRQRHMDELAERLTMMLRSKSSG